MKYRILGEKVQRKGFFQNRQCEVYKGVREITLKKEEMYVKTKYQSNSI